MQRKTHQFETTVETLEKSTSKNESLQQYIAEKFVSPGQGGLQAIQFDVIERGYEMFGLAALGFDKKMQKKLRKDNVDSEALSLITAKMRSDFPHKDSLEQELTQLKTANEKLQYIKAFKNDASHQEASLSLSQLFGNVTDGRDLLIREQMICLTSSNETTEILIAAHSQEPSYCAFRIIAGAMSDDNLILKAPEDLRIEIFQDNDQTYYFRTTTSNYPFVNPHDEQSERLIQSEIETLHVIHQIDENHWGYKLLHIKTNDALIHNMINGRLINQEELMAAYKQPELNETETTTSSVVNSLTFYITVGIGSGILSGGLAYAFSLPLAATLGLGAAGSAGSMFITNQARNPSLFFIPPSQLSNQEEAPKVSTAPRIS